jgi:hypothetical protein
MIFAILTIVAAVSTLYDLSTQAVSNSKRNQLLLSFSIYTNGSNLFQMNQPKSSSEISCLHGIRVISLVGVMLLHEYFFRVLSPFSDSKVYQEFLGTKLASSIAGLNIFVDTFFVISAALLTKSMLKEFEK